VETKQNEPELHLKGCSLAALWLLSFFTLECGAVWFWWSSNAEWFSEHSWWVSAFWIIVFVVGELFAVGFAIVVSQNIYGWATGQQSPSQPPASTSGQSEQPPTQK
jgi:hypothetical protein